MKIAICDDEFEYCDYVESLVLFYLREHCIDHTCFKYSSGEALLSSNMEFDIVFLDVEMKKGQLNGIETAKKIKQQGKCSIVFIITAYQKYLDDAMDSNVFRYIDKPLNPQRIYDGLNKAIDFINHNTIIFQAHDDGILTIRKSDILYVEVIAKKTYVITQQKRYLAREKMAYFKKNLIASYFVSPHSSYVVNMNYIVKLKRDHMQMTNSDMISIAPKKQPYVKKKFMSFMGENNGSLSDDF